MQPWIRVGGEFAFSLINTDGRNAAVHGSAFGARSRFPSNYLTMAYRALSLILMVLTAIISTSPSVRTATTTSQRVSCVKDIVTIVGGGVGIVSGGVGIAATLWKLVNDHRSEGENDYVYSDVPRIPSNHLFQPRPEELRELEEKFNTLEKTNPGDVVVTVYITGDPASGKTQLAGQYGRKFIEMKKHRNKKLFAGTLIADSRSNFLDKYRQIAHNLGCVTARDILFNHRDELESLGMLSICVKKELRKRPGWLLIIDGLSLDERLVEELRPFWPQPSDRNWGKGYVLVTTQDRAPTGPSISKIDLRDGMSRKDAVELITKESNCSNEEGAAELVELLDRSPLSIACAGVYIRNERFRKPSYSFKNYLETVVQKGDQNTVEREELRKGQSPYNHTRKEAVSMTAKQMVSNDPNLHKVFVLLAACAQAPVPLSLVARVLGVQPDSMELEDVLNCALLSPPSTGLGNIETVSVHQVTRSVLKDLLPQDVSTSAVSEQKIGINHIADFVCQEFDTNLLSSSDSVTFQMRRLLTPHIESLLQIHSNFSPDATHEVKLHLALGQSYRHMGRYMEAREVLEKALIVCNKEGIRETREGARVAKELGWTYAQLGMLKESEHISKEALGAFTKLYGEESAEVAEVLNCLGVTYHGLSQLQKSRERFERALKIYEKLYGHKHPSVAGVLMNLGTFWEMKGDKAEAISHYQEALAIEEEILGPNHWKVRATTHNLGVVVRGERGIDLLKRALDITKSVYGEDHPDVAQTLYVLCEIYRELGDLQKAKKIAQDALFILRNFHHPHLMADVQHRLGKIHLELEEFEEAQKHLRHSFATRKEVYGVKNMDTMEAHLWFAMSARLAGNIQHAKEILDTAKDSLLDALIELGKVYLDLGYLTQSLQVHSIALRTSEAPKNFNSDKPNLQVAFRRADLAQALWESGEVRSGLEMMQQALKEYQQSIDTVSENDSVTKPELEDRNTKHVLMLVTMSQMLQDTENLKEARAHLDNALDDLSKSYFPHNLVKAKTIYTYGTLFNKLAAQTTTALNPVAAFLYPWYYRYKARQLLNNALDIMKKVSNAHPNTATILAAIGRLDLDSGDLHSAKLHLKEALNIQTTCCGPVHPNNALYHQLLAEVASQTGDELSSTSHSQEADKIYKILIRRERELSERDGIKLPILQKWQENIGKS